MKGAYLIYKCRKCGVITKDTHAPDGHLATCCIVNDYNPPKEWFGVIPKLLDIHCCKDGNLGVTDFIGCEFDKE